LALILPGNRPSIALEVEVLESVDRKAAAESKKAAGMLLGLVGDNEAAIQDIERGLGPASGAVGPSRTDAPPPDTGPSSSPTGAAGPPPIARPTAAPVAAPAAETAVPREAHDSNQPPELSMDWIRTAVAQAEAARQNRGAGPGRSDQPRKERPQPGGT